uniref:MutS-related protein n=1 Tax=uncultured Draconibacterium sp. TaxID=1573823 RepID=UPI00321720E9
MKERKAEINFFNENDLRLELNKREIDFVEHYRKNRRFTLRANWIDAIKDGVHEKLIPDGDYYVIKEGIFKLVHFLHRLKLFLEELKEYNAPASLLQKLEHCSVFLEHKQFASVFRNLPKTSSCQKWINLGRLDTFFRIKKKVELEKVLDGIYMLDVLQSLAELMKNNHYCLANYNDSGSPVFEVEDGFHPFLEKPVKNSFAFDEGSNICFLTGPNMLGKSTFLKTLGIIIYLSHIGFPIPARLVNTSIQKGLFTTINLSDNLNLGFSHFYSEVKRVKEMAQDLQSYQRIFVIFDELFKGTNVKDAFDSTLMVVQALSKIRNSIFFISSHILEVAEEISNSAKIDFRCFESMLKDSQAVYDYKLKRGISKERVGFQIVKNEKIEEILKEVIAAQSQTSLDEKVMNG